MNQSAIHIFHSVFNLLLYSNLPNPPTACAGSRYLGERHTRPIPFPIADLQEPLPVCSEFPTLHGSSSLVAGVHRHTSGWKQAQGHGRERRHQGQTVMVQLQQTSLYVRTVCYVCVFSCNDLSRMCSDSDIQYIEFDIHLSEKWLKTLPTFRPDALAFFKAKIASVSTYHIYCLCSISSCAVTGSRIKWCH